jgi:hypothetical protein
MQRELMKLFPNRKAILFAQSSTSWLALVVSKSATKIRKEFAKFLIPTVKISTLSLKLALSACRSTSSPKLPRTVCQQIATTDYSFTL